MAHNLHSLRESRSPFKHAEVLLNASSDEMYLRPGYGYDPKNDVLLGLCLEHSPFKRLGSSPNFVDHLKQGRDAGTYHPSKAASVLAINTVTTAPGGKHITVGMPVFAYASCCRRDMQQELEVTCRFLQLTYTSGLRLATNSSDGDPTRCKLYASIMLFQPPPYLRPWLEPLKGLQIAVGPYGMSDSYDAKHCGKRCKCKWCSDGAQIGTVFLKPELLEMVLFTFADKSDKEAARLVHMKDKMRVQEMIDVFRGLAGL